MDELHRMPVFYPHWLTYWKALAVATLFVLASFAGFMIWAPLGIGCLTLALATVIGIGAYRRWNYVTFTEDRRLVRRRGWFGTTTDYIVLMGTITPSQMPILGAWLDVGSVHLSVPGNDIDIRLIDNFRLFCSLLAAGQNGGGVAPVQVYLQLPPAGVDYRNEPGPAPPGREGVR